VSLSKEDFERYDAENPKVWELFERFSLEVLAAGHRHFGAGAVFERIRWYVSVETKGDTWKLNNNYRSFYARKFLQTHSASAPPGFFRLRASVADEVEFLAHQRAAQRFVSGMMDGLSGAKRKDAKEGER